ncbi:MAG: hypothetical protein WAR37_01145 [Candidatus Microsaccharimonas sp.]
MDQVYPDDSFDNEVDFEAINFTESLANQVAFENYLFDNMTQRKVTHKMDVEDTEPLPIRITKENIEKLLPIEVRAIFGDEDCLVEHLSVFQEERPELAFFFMRFTVNDEVHSITTQSNESNAVYTRPNAYGDKVEYHLHPSVAQSLLASFLYVREYSAVKPLDENKTAAIEEGQADEWFSTASMFTIDESAIVSTRIGDCDLIERLVMTLGHFDGVSQTTTSGLLVANGQLMLAELSHTESPHITHASNELELSSYENPIGTNKFERVSLAQHLADIKVFQGENFNDQVGEIAYKDGSKTVTSQTDLKAWSKLCSEFAKTMKTALQPYRYLD